ncbi:transposase, partial [candidate division MSBL1 archaeon SCGC-AAA259E19]
NGMGHWFPYVVEPDVDPTNNQAERDLREPIVIRKIIGTLRNEKGTRIFERVMTMIATWKRQGLHPKDEMLRIVRS